jgi:tetratricopeptide (TPR) repeat protein
MTWNNVAYQLSKRKVHLDRARRYAESAVSSVAAMLRSYNTGNEADKKLAQDSILASLASYWDTLGWVYFQEGNVDAAEKYIEASWNLTQHGEVADHLGQIWEKRGDKAKAAAAYAEALAVVPPYHEARADLDRLVPDKVKSREMVDKARQQAMDERTIKLNHKAKQNLSAEFDITFTAGTPSPDIAFVSGSDQGKTFLSDLQKAKFAFAFPDETPTRVVRHGILSCDMYSGECMVVLVPVTGLPSASAALMLSSNTATAESESAK